MGAITDYLKFKKKNWEEKEVLEFPQDIIDLMKSVVVVQGDWQRRVCLTLKNGSYCHVNADKVSMEKYPDAFELGTELPLEDCKLVVFKYVGPDNPDIKVKEYAALRYAPKNDKEIEEVSGESLFDAIRKAAAQ